MAATVLMAALAVSGCKDKQGSAANHETTQGSGALARYDRFQAVAYNGALLVAVGAFGVVQTSDDHGKQWTRLVLSGAPGLTGVAACGDGHFVALDGGAQTLWSSDAQGRNWTGRKIDGSSDTLLDVTCRADNQIWVVGARGQILTSGDAGQNWAVRSLDEDLQLLNIAFPTPQDGIISGEFGRVLLSHDGGAHWQPGGELGESYYPYAMSFPTPTHGMVTGIGGVLMETTDGGAHWARVEAPTPAPVYGVRLHETGAALIVGAGGTALLRQNGAWSPVAGLAKSDLRGIAETSTGLIVAGTGQLASLPPVFSAPAP